MSLRRCFVPSLLGAALSVGACGSEAPLPGQPVYDEPTEGPAPQTDVEREVAALYQTILDASQGYVAFMCACEITGTTLTVDECVWRNSPPIAPPIAECTQEVLGSDAASLPALECTANVRAAYLACVQESTCLDFEHQLNCQIDILQSTTCPAVPWALWARNEVECIGNLPPESFTCEDGSLIAADWVCDGEADCPDASDEHVCHF